MTRQEIEAAYKVANDKIMSPGKFEGEPVYLPHYYSLILDGCADEQVWDDNDVPHAIFKVDASDVEMWPALANVRVIDVWEDDQGFVRHATVRHDQGMSDAQYQDVCRRID